MAELWKVLIGDVRDVLPTLDECSFDAVLCDPPYHLTQASRNGSPRTNDPETPFGRHRIGERGFMGQVWDGGDIAINPATWAAVLRCLRPGAPLLAFGGSRTHHRMMCAIEDAGFEIRDCLMYLYGSGFPKSLDISKSLDHAAGDATREQARVLREKREEVGLTREEVAERVGCTPSSIRDWEEGRARAVGAPVEYIIPSDEYRTRLAEVLGLPVEERADHRRVVGVASDRRDDGSVYDVGHSGVLREGGNTPAAQTWKGYGTALKPAWEPIVLARKPLDGTVAGNVQAHGTGGLNVDECRIGTGEDKGTWPLTDRTDARNAMAGPMKAALTDTTIGRWPSNLMFDEEAAAQLDAQSGILTSGVFAGDADGDEAGGNLPWFGQMAKRPASRNKTPDSGGASRFFYTAKVSTSERNDGLDDIGELTKNPHPTMKPVSLTEYLAKLIIPPRGIGRPRRLLIPFCGVASEIVGALRAGWDDIVGIELSEEYAKIAMLRLRRIDTSHQPSLFG